MARGHRIEEVNEVPLVVSDGVEKLMKTANAVALLKRFGAYSDVEKVKDSKKIRRGKGKMRNRRYTQRRGPLVIYNEDSGMVKAFRNIPGVELCNVERLNLLQLAPGGHLGRFCVWTQGAFAKLDRLYGTYRAGSERKTGYHLPRPCMANADLTRIINSTEVQAKVRPAQKQVRTQKLKKNPLKNLGAMAKLNPNAIAQKRRALKVQAAQKAAKAALVEAKRKGTAPKRTKAQLATKACGRKFYAAMSAPTKVE
jgi:large subunit ribosomal protein L4e